MFKKKKDKYADFKFNPNLYKKINIKEIPDGNHVYKYDEDKMLVINEYSQVNINTGIMCGMPSDLSPYFKYSFKIADAFFENKEYKDYYMIDPIIYTENFNNTDTYLLPQFLTTAKINRFGESLPDGDDGETINIVWWQNTFGKPEEYIIEQIKKITWKPPYAWTWGF